MDRLSRMFAPKEKIVAGERRKERRVMVQEDLCCEARRLEVGGRWARCAGAPWAAAAMMTRGQHRMCDSRCAALAAARRVVAKLAQSSIVELVCQRDVEDFARRTGRVVCELACEAGDDSCCVVGMSSDDSDDDTVVADLSLVAADALDDLAACVAVLMLFAPSERVAVCLGRCLVAQGGLLSGPKIWCASRVTAMACCDAYPELARSFGSREAAVTTLEIVMPRLVSRAMVDAVPLPVLVAVWDEFFEAVKRERAEAPRQAPPPGEGSPLCAEKRRIERRTLGMVCPRPAAALVRAAVALVGCARTVTADAIKARLGRAPRSVAVAVLRAWCYDADADNLVAELQDIGDLSLAADLTRTAAHLEDADLQALVLRVDRNAARRVKEALDDMEVRESRDSTAMRLRLQDCRPLVDDDDEDAWTVATRAFELASSVDDDDEELKDDTESQPTLALVRAALALLRADTPPRARLRACLAACAEDHHYLTATEADVAARLLDVAARSHMKAKTATLRLAYDGTVDLADLEGAALSDLAVIRLLYAATLLDKDLPLFEDSLSLSLDGASTAQPPSDGSAGDAGPPRASSLDRRRVIPGPPSHDLNRDSGAKTLLADPCDSSCFFCRPAVVVDKRPSDRKVQASGPVCSIM